MVLRLWGARVLNFVSNKRSAVFSIADQGTSAVALFVFTTLATRHLSQDEFGLVSVYLAWASLLGALMQPMLIDASAVMTSRMAQPDARYRAAAAGAYLALMAMALAGALVSSAALGWQALPSALGWLVASELAVSFVAFLRRSAYLGQRTATGWGVSMLSLVLTVLVMPFILDRPGAAATDVFIARALINALAALLALLATNVIEQARVVSANLACIAEMFAFSRVYVAGSLIFWVTNSLQVALIGHALSLDDAAGYRVAQLLVLPASQLQAAVYQLMLPRTVARLAESPNEWGAHARRLGHWFIWPTLAYAAAVGAIAPLCLEQLFGPEYARFAWVVLALAALAVLDAAKQVAVVMLYAQNRQALFMKYRLVALGLFVLTTVPALLMGQLGYFLVAAAVTNALLLAYLLHGFFNLSDTPQAAR